MPLEKSLNDPITAAEMKEIIMARVRKALDANSLLADDITYPAFGFRFEATLIFPQRLNPPKKSLIWDRQGAQEGIEEQVIEEYQSPDSPNLTRQENGLPLPVMVKTPTGMEKRRVFQR